MGHASDLLLINPATMTPFLACLIFERFGIEFIWKTESMVFCYDVDVDVLIWSAMLEHRSTAEMVGIVRECPE